jgi:hypothetical protein
MYLHDLKLSNDPNLGYFTQYMELQYSSGQVPDYIQYLNLILYLVKTNKQNRPHYTTCYYN